MKIIPELKTLIDEKEEEISNLQTNLEENNNEIEVLQNAMHNLQLVHEESQQRNEILAKKYDSELKRLRGVNNNLLIIILIYEMNL